MARVDIGRAPLTGRQRPHKSDGKCKRGAQDLPLAEVFSRAPLLRATSSAVVNSKPYANRGGFRWDRFFNHLQSVAAIL